ncbi:MAG TPA: gliding motility-associated C-terminal domain-containing protein, partial [Fluviicola sp.]|nr:gliding motility-associated C-terminal domain-containing protein [Fluviicola sp.]
FYDESQGAMKWIYYMNENNAFLSDSAPAFTFQTPGMHYPEQVVFNEFGCSDTTKMQLIVEPFTVFVPNTFTPDENQFNNTFNAVVGLEPVSWNMRIYNRWGQLIFETNDYQEAWDGTYKGKLCQEDIYSYVIQFTSCAPVANAEELTGHVLLIK